MVIPDYYFAPITAVRNFLCSEKGTNDPVGDKGKGRGRKKMSNTDITKFCGKLLSLYSLALFTQMYIL